MKKKLLILVLALGMITSITACGSSSSTPYTSESSSQDSSVQTTVETPELSTTPSGNGHYTMSQVGTIDNKEGNIGISNNTLVSKDNNGTVHVLAPDGQDKLGKTYMSAKAVIDGYYAVADSADDINSTGLVTAEGEELIPCEVAMISDITYDNYTSHRYVKVYYTTGTTTNQDDCILYATDSMFSLQPDEDDIMYTGYAQIYDLQEKKFVDNVKVTNGYAYAVKPCGNSFIVEVGDGTTVLYNADGSAVLTLDTTYYDSGEGFIGYSKGGTYYVYDESGKETLRKDTSISSISGKGGYLKEYTDDVYTIIDIFGNPLMSQTFDSVCSCYDGVFMVENNDKYGLVAGDGTEIVPCTFDDNFTYIDWGFWYNGSSPDYNIFNANGVVAEHGDGYANKLVLFKENSSSSDIFVLNDGDYTLTVDSTSVGSTNTPGLATTYISGEGYGLYDTFSGEQLLPNEYKEIFVLDDYVYASREGTITVYEMTYSE